MKGVTAPLRGTTTAPPVDGSAWRCLVKSRLLDPLYTRPVSSPWRINQTRPESPRSDRVPIEVEGSTTTRKSPRRATCCRQTLQAWWPSLGVGVKIGPAALRTRVHGGYCPPVFNDSKNEFPARLALQHRCFFGGHGWGETSHWITTRSIGFAVDLQLHSCRPSPS